MSGRELERAQVTGRVKSRDLRLLDAAAMLAVSYRQAKRLSLGKKAKPDHPRRLGYETRMARLAAR